MALCREFAALFDGAEPRLDFIDFRKSCHFNGLRRFSRHDSSGGIGCANYVSP
jgi:hypothetical protein